MTFAEQIKAHRNRLRLTQAACAALLEISKRTLENWERESVPAAVAREGALARLEKIATV